MARLKEKKQKRHQVHFMVPESLHRTYRELLQRARSMNLIIQLGEEFNRWFSQQVTQIEAELQRRGSHQSAEPEQGPAGSPHDHPRKDEAGKTSPELTATTTDKATAAAPEPCVQTAPLPKPAALAQEEHHAPHDQSGLEAKPPVPPEQGTASSIDFSDIDMLGFDLEVADGNSR